MLQAAKDVCLAAADDVTRQRCVRIIEAASVSSSLLDIASSAALTRGLLDMKSLSAVKAVLAALGVAMDHPSLKAVGYDLPSLKAAGFDLAAFRAAGYDWLTVNTAGFSATEAKAAGCDPASARAGGYDLISLVVAYGYDAVAAAGVDVSFFKAFKGRENDLSICILVSSLLCTCAHTRARPDPPPPPPCSVTAPTFTSLFTLTKLTIARLFEMAISLFTCLLVGKLPPVMRMIFVSVPPILGRVIASSFRMATPMGLPCPLPLISVLPAAPRKIQISSHLNIGQKGACDCLIRDERRAGGKWSDYDVLLRRPA